MVLPLCITIPLAALGAVFSMFYGLRACEAFEVPKCDERPIGWKVHQFWFNFTGSAFGWAGLWFLMRRAWSLVASGSTGDFTASDWALVAFTLIGITGHIPISIASAIGGFKSLAQKATGFLS